MGSIDKTIVLRETPIAISFNRFAHGDSALRDLADMLESVGLDACPVRELSLLFNLCEWACLLYVLNAIAMTDKWDIYAGYIRGFKYLSHSLFFLRDSV